MDSDDSPLPSKRYAFPVAPARSAATTRTRTRNDLAAANGVSRSAVSLGLEGKVGVPARPPCCRACCSRAGEGNIDLLQPVAADR
jgi:hypothetical protein